VGLRGGIVHYILPIDLPSKADSPYASCRVCGTRELLREEIAASVHVSLLFGNCDYTSETVVLIL
jgi:hypothetical protein